MVNLVTCLFHFFEALTDAFEVLFSGLHFYTLSTTLIACRHRQLKFFYGNNVLKTMPLFYFFFFTFKRDFSTTSFHLIILLIHQTWCATNVLDYYDYQKLYRITVNKLKGWWFESQQLV